MEGATRDRIAGHSRANFAERAIHKIVVGLERVLTLARIHLFQRMVLGQLGRSVGRRSGFPPLGIGMAVAISVITLGIAGCTTLKTTLRYRLTVVIDTPQGIRAGSSVVEAKGYLNPAFPGPEAGGPRLHLRGEAVPVDLGNGKYLFAAFAWVSPPTRIFTMLTVPFKDQLPPISSDPSEVQKSMMRQFRALADARGVRAVKSEDYPVIATFADRMNPYSVRIAPATELPMILPGYRVVRMTVEIVDSPVSNRILTILPWLRRTDLGFLNQDISRNRSKPFPEYQKLTTDSFIAGVYFPRNYKRLKGRINHES